MSLPKFTALLLVAGLLQGCFSVRYHSPTALTEGARRGVTHKTWSHSFLWGIIPATRVPLDGWCGDREILKMKSSLGPMGFLGQAITLGIWTPMRLKIVCADRPTDPVLVKAPAPPAIPAMAPGPSYYPPEGTVLVQPSQGGVLVAPPDGRSIIVIR